jgi:hypothetical protein
MASERSGETNPPPTSFVLMASRNGGFFIPINFEGYIDTSPSNLR